jgi:tRNA dimethylallyltransferase
MTPAPAPARPWIGLAGPTASGKTAVTLRLARHLPIEVISVDSALVYRGMDIGTAKPSLAEQAQVPHHLIDLIDPRQAYSAAQFVQDAQRLIGDVHARGRLPLLVGGTMLYFKALMHGIDALPQADAAVRAAIDAEAAQHGWPALHAELARVDPTTAARLAPNDAQRIQRALEVHRLTGLPLASFHHRDRDRTPAGSAAQGPSGLAAAAAAANPAPDPAGTLLSLEPVRREWLHRRIAERFDAMLAQGLLDEVQALRARGDLHTGLPSMRCVGYRQAWEALDAGLSGPALQAAVRERGIVATRQLAKRQLTWLRSLPRQALAADGPDPAAAVLPLVQAWWQRHGPA